MAQAPALDEVILKGYDPKLTRRLFTFVLPYRGFLGLSLLLMFISSGAAAVGPYLVKVALDSGLQARSLPVLRNTVLLYILVAGIQWLAIFTRVNIMARIGQSIIYDMRQQLFEYLQKLSLSFFSRYSVGRVIVRVINDVGVLRDFIIWTLLAIARDLFTVVFIMVAMFALDVRLSLLTFITLPVMVGITILFRKKARENYRNVRAAISWVNSVLAENINGVRVVQAFSRQQKNYEHFREVVNRNNLVNNLKAARIASLYPSAIDFMGTAAVSVVVWIGGRAVLGQEAVASTGITPGVLVAFILYIERFFEPIRDLSQRYDTFQSTMAASERIFGLLDTPVEIQDAPDAMEMPAIRGRFVSTRFLSTTLMIPLWF